MSLSLIERDRRYSVIRGLMGENDIDCLLVVGRDGYTSRGNLRYVSNYGVNFGEQYCIFPFNGEPAFLGSVMAGSQVRRAGWIGECRELADPAEQIVREMSQFDKGNRMGIVGLPTLSVPVYLALGDRFHQRVSDANSIFKEVRIIKSPEEIALVRTSALAADRAYGVVREIIRPGLSDFEICGEVKRVLYEMGSEYSMEFIDAEGTDINFFHPVGNRLSADGTLALEITPACQGYYAQLTVTVPVTEYPRHIEPLLPVWHDAVETGEGLLKPGTRACDVHRLISKGIRDRGYVSHLRAGHGIGLDALEFFSLSGAESTELREGMTLAFHPCVAVVAGGDGIGMGCTYLITDGGCERLSRMSL